jgi:cob(I)alamin adenosyltransferase
MPNQTSGNDDMISPLKNKLKKDEEKLSKLSAEIKKAKENLITSNNKNKDNKIIEHRITELSTHIGHMKTTYESTRILMILKRDRIAKDLQAAKDALNVLSTNPTSKDATNAQANAQARVDALQDEADKAAEDVTQFVLQHHSRFRGRRIFELTLPNGKKILVDYGIVNTDPLPVIKGGYRTSLRNRRKKTETKKTEKTKKTKSPMYVLS